VIDDITFTRHSMVNAYTEAYAGEQPNEAFVRIVARVRERTTGKPFETSTSCRFFLPESVAEVLERVSAAVSWLMDHEGREAFHYMGRRIFDPHK
jgi:hypothetical protein